MSVYRDPSSPFYYCDFEVGGRRHKRSTKKRSRREAQAVERELKERARAELHAGTVNPSLLTLEEGIARYLREVGEDAETFAQFARILSYVGGGKPMAGVTRDDVSHLVAWLQRQRKWGRGDTPWLSNATVNRTGVELLRRVFTRARKHWGASFPHEPDWTTHRLEEPEPRPREFHGGERQAIELAMRDDYGPLLAFALATGFRFKECVTLKWSEVNWQGRVIEKLGKKRKVVRTRITSAVEAILRPLERHHPDAVFTYVARATRDGRVRGTRYPATVAGTKTAWRRYAKARSGVANLKFHHCRSDFGTRVHRAAKGDITVTQRALNHANIASSVRYLAVTDDSVTAALEAAQSPTIYPTTAERKAG